jgi:hypothetical protein
VESGIFSGHGTRIQAHDGLPTSRKMKARRTSLISIVQRTFFQLRDIDTSVLSKHRVSYPCLVLQSRQGVGSSSASVNLTGLLSFNERAKVVSYLSHLATFLSHCLITISNPTWE